MQKALQELLYTGGGLQGARLSVLLNGAMGVVARTKGGAFVDFDTVPEESVGLPQALSYLLSPGSRSLRQILVSEAVVAADVLLRQALRKAAATLFNALPRPPLFAQLLPRPETVPTPFLLPTASGQPAPAVVEPERLLDAAAPRLTRDEELYAIAIVDLVAGAVGRDAAVVVSGDAVLDPRAVARLALSVISTGRAPGLSAMPAPLQSALLQVTAALAGRPATAMPLSGGAGPGEAGAADEVLETLGNLTAAERSTLDAVVRQVPPPYTPHPTPHTRLPTRPGSAAMPRDP
jgi:aarF domain-containing kinase